VQQQAIYIAVHFKPAPVLYQPNSIGFKLNSFIFLLQQKAFFLSRKIQNEKIDLILFLQNLHLPKLGRNFNHTESYDSSKQLKYELTKKEKKNKEKMSNHKTINSCPLPFVFLFAD
jgi:hypothetical protein